MPSNPPLDCHGLSSGAESTIDLREIPLWPHARNPMKNRRKDVVSAAHPRISRLTGHIPMFPVMCRLSIAPSFLDVQPAEDAHRASCPMLSRNPDDIVPELRKMPQRNLEIPWRMVTFVARSWVSGRNYKKWPNSIIPTSPASSGLFLPGHVRTWYKCSCTPRVHCPGPAGPQLLSVWYMAYHPPALHNNGSRRGQELSGRRCPFHNFRRPTGENGPGYHLVLLSISSSLFMSVR